MGTKSDHGRPDSSPAILLVEDDEATRETLHELLELEGYHVRSAKNGMDALAILNDGHPICAILLDWMMPRMNGQEFTAALQADPRFRDIPVTVLTAVSGIDPTLPRNHIKKPAPLGTILSRIGPACRRPE